MNGVDVAVLLVVAFSGVMAFMRGLVREVLGLAAWIGAGIAAFALFPRAQPLMRHTIPNPDIADPVAFGGVFLIVLIVLSVGARIISGAARRSGLGGLDRTLGLIYGLARGAVIMIAAYIAAGTLEPMDNWPSAVLEARSLPSIYLGAVWVVARLPEEMRPVLAVPPAGRTTTAADLLHANPIGRALAAPVGPAIGERSHE
jgi:membrane protein required for colicin V production